MSGNDTRINVYQQCKTYQQEWISQGIRYKPQRVANGTLFDLKLCGLNFAYNVVC